MKSYILVGHFPKKMLRFHWPSFCVVFWVGKMKDLWFVFCSPSHFQAMGSVCSLKLHIMAYHLAASFCKVLPNRTSLHVVPVPPESEAVSLAIQILGFIPNLSGDRPHASCTLRTAQMKKIGGSGNQINLCKTVTKTFNSTAG